MNIRSAKLVILAASKADDTVIMEGLHGIGKSAIVKQFAKEQGYNKEELFLSHQEVGDIIGIPTKVEIDGEQLTVWSKPIWFQRIIDAAWPAECMYGALHFNNGDFKSFVDSKLGKVTSDTIVSRVALNEYYIEFFRILDGHLQLVNGQTEVLCSESRQSVLFLDELNRAPIDVRQSALQLVLERQIHEHVLPTVNGKRTMIVAAINPADTYQVDELDAALLDRFLHIDLEADVDAWLDWARETEVNSVVTSFLAEFPDKLHYIPEDGSKGATPRAWAKLAAFMDIADEIPREVMFSIMKGKIGQLIGGQFLSYFNNFSKVIKMEDVEKLVEEQSKRVKKVETLGKKVNKLMEHQEALQKHELAKQLIKKYIDVEEVKDAMPLMAYLYGLDLEILASFLKDFKASDNVKYLKIAKLDGELNGKALFLKILSKVQ